jgi:perosamine synthetase
MKIPLYKSYLTETDIEYVNRVLKRESFWVNGPEIRELEKKVSEKMNSKYAVAMNSGTSGLHAMMIAHGIGEGDEVIVPAFTFVSTANAPLFVGAKPVFADIEKETYSLDPDDVRKKITNKTKAIILVHYGGMPAIKIKEIKEIADEKNILLLEDAAESFGAKIDGKYTGNFGDSTMYSFCGNKVVTSGEGGLVTTNNEEVYEKLKTIISHGRIENGDYFTGPAEVDYVRLGYNFRMSSITAALILSQINNFDIIIKKRRDVAKKYNELLEKYKVKLPMDNKRIFNVYQMYSIEFENNTIREKVKENLIKNEIGCKVYFDPIYEYSFHKKYKINLVNTDEISKKILSVPIYPDMKEKEIEFVVEKIKEVIDI